MSQQKSNILDGIQLKSVSDFFKLTPEQFNEFLKENDLHDWVEDVEEYNKIITHFGRKVITQDMLRKAAEEKMQELQKS